MQGLLVKYGEIALRGKNRHIFENKLIEAIYTNINGDEKKYIVKKEQGRLLILNANNGQEIDYVTLIPKAINTIGVTYVCPCDIIQEQDIKNLQDSVLNYVKNNYFGKYTFKIVTKRAVKSYPLTSLEVSKEIGQYVFENIEGAEVDVIKPNVTINVELRTNAYVFSKVIKGVGGLPQGGGGKALVLLSGGIDSPVAAFLTARRGLDISCIYFHSSPYTSEHARQKVLDICKRLGTYTGGITLNVVNFTPVQLYLYKNVPQDKITIFLKRAMVKIAGIFANEKNFNALVMGDSIGQVASQTIHSIMAIDSVNPMLPIIRPLATYDKQDIINISTKIETYPISILPYEDCCTIFVPKHPTTKPNVQLVEKIWCNLSELPQLIQQAIYEIEVIKV